MGRVIPLEERFWSKVDKSGECWVWTGARTAPGWHGVIKARDRKEVAHRVSWEMAHGPIPPGLHVLHWCDNPACVRPDHLWLGTQRQNMQDASRKGRTAPQIRVWTHCKRGHPLTPDNIYLAPKAGARRACLTCVRMRSRARPSRAERRITAKLRAERASIDQDRLAAEMMDEAM